MSQHQSNYEPHERVIHKLLGAAYQMTFDGQYEMAVQTSVTAVTYWRQIQDGAIDQEEAAALIGKPSPETPEAQSAQAADSAKTDGGVAAQSSADADTEESFVCGDCGKEFDSKAALDGHGWIHDEKYENGGPDGDEGSGLDALFEQDDSKTDNQGNVVSITPDTLKHEIAKVLVYGSQDDYTAKEVVEKVDGNSQSVQPYLSKLSQSGWVEANRPEPDSVFRYSAGYDLKRRVQEIGEAS